MEFWTNGALVHDYLPCVQGGVAGFKDLVDGAVVTSGGLTSGGDIAAEEGDGYIESTNGNCYIDTGTVKTDALSSATAFEIGGMGVDGGGSAFEVVPQNTKVSPNKTVTLTAYAPGAISYRWTKNGEVVAGETAGSLTVAWEKTPRQSVCAVTPVYSVNGKAVDGAPVAAIVENLLRGMVFYIR